MTKQQFVLEILFKPWSSLGSSKYARKEETFVSSTLPFPFAKILNIFMNFIICYRSLLMHHC